MSGGGLEQAAQGCLIEVLNMSLTASVMILAVLAARMFLKRAPRLFSYALWAVVLFRLLCPVSFSAPLSLLGVLQNEASAEGRMEYIPADIGYQMEPKVQLPAQSLNQDVDEAVNGVLPPGSPQTSVNPLQIILYIAVRIWILGMGILLLYSVVSLVRLKKRLKTAVRERDRIYRLKERCTPFVFGIFHLRIYLPEDLGAQEERYILLHEEIHIRRRDPLFRALAWLALCLHWFNPLVWAAFHISGRDMEMACDEAVLQKLGLSVKKEYSASLLSFASGQRGFQGMPLAFGESDTGSRIRNVLRYRKPKKLLSVVGVILCGVLALWLLANPADDTQAASSGIAGSLAVSGMDEVQERENEAQTEIPAELTKEKLSGGQAADGVYRIYMKSISRSIEGIDLYVVDSWDTDEDGLLPLLPFADSCIYLPIINKGIFGQSRAVSASCCVAFHSAYVQYASFKLLAGRRNGLCLTL